MEHCPEVYAAEKQKIGCDASMRSPRKGNARDPLKEHATADDFSEFWPELDNLGNKLHVIYTHCRLLFCLLFIVVYCFVNSLVTNSCYYATLPRSQWVA